MLNYSITATPHPQPQRGSILFADAPPLLFHTAQRVPCIDGTYKPLHGIFITTLKNNSIHRPTFAGTHSFGMKAIVFKISAILLEVTV